MGKLIAVLILVVLLIPGVASANLLANAGFESTGPQGHLTGWAVDWNAGNQAGVQDNPSAGAWNARNFNDGGMYQDVPVTVGLAYQLKGYAFIPSGLGGSPWGTYIGLKYLNSAGATIPGAAGSKQIDMQGMTRDQYNLADTGWMVAPATAVTARIRFGTWANDPWLPVSPTDFDSFDFSIVPEPTSLMLLGSGLVGLVGLTRKKRA